MEALQTGQECPPFIAICKKQQANGTIPEAPNYGWTAP